MWSSTIYKLRYMTIGLTIFAMLAAGCATRRAPQTLNPPLAQKALPAPSSAPAPASVERCDAPPAFASAARYNAAAEVNLAFSPFGRPEVGWAAYEPLAAETVQTFCAPDTPGFAAAVARWQSQHGLSPDGALTAETFQTLKGAWQARRPFVMLRVSGVCPAGADEASLATLGPEETLGDKPVRLRPAALQALRRMVEAARAEEPQIAADPDLLKAFSGYRSPAADAARCGVEGDCHGLVRAECSSHRTGLAVDVNVGWAPGSMADSSTDVNRLHQSRTTAYRWLVRNAARFGFVNYPFEPWHWEWTGEAP
jgi:LAS superfamily LD-carboxypeptidase LdcB